MNSKTRTSKKIVYTRREFDDVYVARSLDVYVPDFSKRKVSTRTWFQSAVMGLIMFVSAGLGTGTVGLSGAFLSDTELSPGNSFIAQIHDFSASAAPENLKVIPEGSSVDVPLLITPTPGTPALYYRVSTTYVAGEQSLCDALTTSSTGTIASGAVPLLSFNGTAFVAPDMTFAVSLPVAVPDLPVDAPCTFDIVVRSWNALVPESTGYFDEERMRVTIIDPPAPVPVTMPAPESVEDPAPELPPDPVPEPVPEPITEPEPQVQDEPAPEEPAPIPEPIVEPAPEPQPEDPI